MKRFVTPAILTILTLFYAQAVPAQQPSAEELKGLREEIKALKEGQTAIQKDLQEIKNLLRSRPAQPAAPRDIVLNIDGDPFKGDKNTKLVLVDFSEYQ